MNVWLETRFENVGKERWNALISQNETNTIFQTYEWHYTWWKVFGMDKELFLVCVEDKNSLIGLAPLMICRNENGKKVLRFIGHGRADYTDFIYLDKEILDQIFESKWNDELYHP